MNNPLSYTDPTGFFFKKLFKSIGRAIGGFFKAVGRVLKKALQNPIIRGIIQIVGCAVTAAATAGAGCVAISAALTLAAGGSVADALQAGAFSLASMGVFAVAGQVVDLVTSGLQLAGAAADVAFTAIKAGIHGIAGGALSVAQGGSFSQGFIASAIGAVGGQLSQGAFGRYGDGVLSNQLGRAAISAIAGCGGAVLSGGKCANGAVTAAFASLFNGDNYLGTRYKGSDSTFAPKDGHASFKQLIENEPYSAFPPEFIHTDGIRDATGDVIGAGSLLFTGGAGAVAWRSGAVGGRAIGRSLFGYKGGYLNRGRYFRIGVNRGLDGGRFSFRIGGEYLRRITGRGHIHLKDLGPIPKNKN